MSPDHKETVPQNLFFTENQTCLKEDKIIETKLGSSVVHRLTD